MPEKIVYNSDDKRVLVFENYGEIKENGWLIATVESNHCFLTEIQIVEQIEAYLKRCFENNKHVDTVYLSPFHTIALFLQGKLTNRDVSRIKYSEDEKTATFPSVEFQTPEGREKIKLVVISQPIKSLMFDGFQMAAQQI